MAHTITLSDEQFARLEAAGRLYQKSVEQVIADLLSGFPPEPPVAPGAEDEEYERRWASFMQLVGSISEGAPLSNEEIDERIGEEAAETHATATDERDSGER